MASTPRTYRFAFQHVIRAASPMSRGPVAALLLVGAIACISSDATGPTVQVTVVEFVYQASTSIDISYARAEGIYCRTIRFFEPDSCHRS